jgi:prephenate dehydrogenase
MSERLERVTILGVGLIGGSMGMALRFRGVAGRVVGCSRTESRLWEAQRHGAIDEYTTDPVEAVAGADLVILAAPVRTIVSLSQTVAPALRPGAIVTDVGSTKGEIVSVLEGLLEGRARFVGGHPMAGSERSGIRYARGDLFHRAAYFLTPTAETDGTALETVRGVVSELGARAIEVSPEEHDRIVAAISHLPHVAASCLAAAVPELCGDAADRALSASAGGFADTTRVAGGDPDLWRDIALQNRDELATAIALLRGKLAAFEEALRGGDESAVRELFADGRDVRESMARVKGSVTDSGREA